MQPVRNVDLAAHVRAPDSGRRSRPARTRARVQLQKLITSNGHRSSPYSLIRRTDSASSRCRSRSQPTNRGRPQHPASSPTAPARLVTGAGRSCHRASKMRRQKAGVPHPTAAHAAFDRADERHSPAGVHMEAGRTSATTLTCARGSRRLRSRRRVEDAVARPQSIT